MFHPGGWGLLLDFSLEIEVVSAVVGICGRELRRLEEIPFRFIEAVIAFLGQPQVEIGVPRARIRPDRTAHDQRCAVVFLLVEVKHSESKQRSERRTRVYGAAESGLSQLRVAAIFPCFSKGVV